MQPRNRGCYVAKKKPFNPRKLMEKAVKVMTSSIREARDDGKVIPFVGAVLWKVDGTVETAYRGELRDGDHAEFTLLERKNPSCRLDKAVLFATLEPCAPKARTFPKLGCAERIVLARIKQVWVGIADPDPTVDRKGIKYLQDNGVEVQMFDRDLQDKICEINKQFIDQAMERAETAKEKEQKTVKLSDLEDEVSALSTSDFSLEALEKYRDVAKIKELVESSQFRRRLLQQGLLKGDEATCAPTRLGVLLFGKEPRVTMPQAGLLGTIHYPDDTEEPRNFEGPMVLIPGEVEQWLRDKLPNVIDRSTMQRQEADPLPFEMIREAVVNALIHRDYGIRQAKCQLVVTPTTILVKSPGGPLPPITLEQLQTFEAPMLSRNPELHYVFSRMELAEERGFGLRSLKNQAQQSHLPLPRFSWEDPYLVLTLYRNPEASLPEGMTESLSASELAGWRWLAQVGHTKTSEYAKEMDVDARTARRHLTHFVELQLLRKIGSGPATRYEVA